MYINGDKRQVPKITIELYDGNYNFGVIERLISYINKHIVNVEVIIKKY